ncbi:MAG: hypothetical protein CTY18_02975 [Methylomonas sp.]|nr:MAG: hypothetical protein CTY18_02975 [Methylomonas sp.]
MVSNKKQRKIKLLKIYTVLKGMPVSERAEEAKELVKNMLMDDGVYVFDDAVFEDAKASNTITDQEVTR